MNRGWTCPENCKRLPSYGYECPDDLGYDEPCPLGIIIDNDKGGLIYMFEITVKIEAPALVEAIHALAASVTGNTELRLVDSETKTDPVKTEPVQTEGSPKITDPQKDSPEQTGTDTTVIPTVVELRAKAQEKGTTPEQKQSIKTLLDKYESKSISSLPEDKRAAFLVDLEAL